MIKKSFLVPILAPAALISLLLITPVYAHAGWFGEKSFAAAITIGSFFSKIKSFFTRPSTLPEKPSGPIQANCTPSVPAKPAGIDLVSPYGSLTITPEISTAGPDNIVTVSLNPNLDSANFVRIYVPFPANFNDDIIDWYPKEVNRTNYSTGDGLFTWSPSSPNYWIKVRMRDATIQKQAKNTTNADGWKKISYIMRGFKPGRVPTEVKGSQGYYVGREQKPSLITTIGTDTFKRTIYAGTPPLKPFTVAPNGYFEIQTKSLGQPGTITLGVKNAKILNGAKQEVKADETITWKIQPLGTDPVQLLELSLKNSCGEDYLVDPAKSAKLPDSSKFTFPIVYDTAVPKKSEPQPKPPAPAPATLKPTPTEQSKKVFPQNLVVSQNRALAGLKEGDKVTFTAKLVMSDGSAQIVKENVKWGLIGQVGNITAAGVFTAKLDEAIAEYGEGSGIVTAIYTDAAGTPFLGKTPVFQVEAFVPDDAGVGG